MTEVFRLLGSIGINGVDQVNSDLQEVSTQSERTARANENLGATYTELQDDVKASETRLKELKNQYANVVLQQGKNSDAAKELEAEMNDLNKGLEVDKKRLKEAEQASDSFTSSLEQNGHKVKTTAESFQDLGNKAGELGKKFAIGMGALATAVTVGVESTREFRQDWGKLTTTFEEAGASTETAKQVFKDFYGLLGEDDTSIEAANHLAQMTSDQKELSEWTDICTGVYAKFGDSLPLEGLTEAANETKRVGQLTGPLTDAINWAAKEGETFGLVMKASTKENEEFNKALIECTSAEDYFNLALQECNSEAERETLIRTTLNGIYGDSASAFKENNKEIIEANKAQADLSLQLNDTMNKLEPLITQVKLFLAEMLEKAQPFITWAINNIGILAPLVIGFLGTLLALNIASKVGNFIKNIKTLNATMAANPIGLIIMAIGLLITVFVELWNNCEGFRNFWIGLWDNIKAVLEPVIEWIKEVFRVAWEAIKIVWDAVKPYFEGIWNGIKAVFSVVKEILEGYFKVAWEAIKFIWDTVVGYFKMIWENIKAVFSVVKSILSGDFQGAWDGIKKIWSNVADFFQGVWDGIKNIFGGVADWFKDVFTKAWEGVRNVFSAGGKIFNGIKDGIANVFKTVVNGIIKGINKVISFPFNKINGMLNAIRNVGVAGVKPFKGLWKQDPLPVPQIPELYEGALLEKGQKGYLEGNGAEAVVPLHNNKKWINAVANDMGNAIGTNNDIDNKLDKLLDLLNYYLPALTNRQLCFDTGAVVGALVNPLDQALANKDEDRRKGR